MALAPFIQACAKNVSGASLVYIADKSVATAFTVVSHEVTAVTGTTPFQRVDAVTDSVSWEEKVEPVGLNNLKVTNTIKFKVAPPKTATSTFLQALMDGSPCGFFAIIVDSNSQCWLVGHNEYDVRARPLKLKGQTQATGEGLSSADGNVVLVELGNECSGKALPFASGINATILAQSDSCLKLT
jgi:hypothetical protein